MNHEFEDIQRSIERDEQWLDDLSRDHLSLDHRSCDDAPTREALNRVKLAVRLTCESEKSFDPEPALKATQSAKRVVRRTFATQSIAGMNRYAAPRIMAPLLATAAAVFCAFVGLVNQPASAVVADPEWNAFVLTWESSESDFDATITELESSLETLDSEPLALSELESELELWNVDDFDAADNRDVDM